VKRLPMQLDDWTEVVPALVGARALRVRPFAVPGKIALYLEDESAGTSLGTQEGDTIGLEVSDGQSSFHYIPGLAAIESGVEQHLKGSKLLFLDGTLFTDDEMIAQGLSQKTGRRMGHISMSGPEGSLAALSGLGIARRVYIHMNNSNPVLRENSKERAEVIRQGWEVAYDGMEFNL